MTKNIFIGCLLLVVIVLAVTLVQLNQKSSLLIKPEVTSIKDSRCKNLGEIKDYTTAIKLAFAKEERPKIIFDPSVTSQDDMNEVREKVLAPYTSFKTDSTPISNHPQLFIVHKVSEDEADKTNGAKYQIDEIYSNGQSGMWLEGKINVPLSTWIPQCMGNCKFSSSFQSKYPEIVAAYKALHGLK